MNRTLLFSALLLALSPLTSLAQRSPGQVYPITSKGAGRVVSPSAVAVTDSSGQLIGEFEAVTSTLIEKDAPSWKMAFDSMSTNPISFSVFGNQYGAHAGPKRLFIGSKNYMYANDMVKLNTGTPGKTATRGRVGVCWNPNGTDPVSGTADLMVRVHCANSFDTTSDGPAVDDELSGVVYAFPNLAAGEFLTLDMNLTNTGLGLPLPYDGGAIVVELGTIGAGNTFQPLPSYISAQPVLGNMVSLGEPQYPGTNPSQSSEFQWDDNTDPNFPFIERPNYVFEDFYNTANWQYGAYAELYGYDYTYAGWGVLQAATGLFIDNNALTISGTISFEDLVNPSNKPRTATFDVHDAVTDAYIAGPITVALSATGAYTLLDPLPTTGGYYRLYAKSSHWLRKSLLVNTTSKVSQTGKNFSLKNGDIDGDNCVSIFDYSALSIHFDMDSTALDWKRVDPSTGTKPCSSDLDGDDTVSIFDYSILSLNFDLNGE